MTRRRQRLRKKIGNNIMKYPQGEFEAVNLDEAMFIPKGMTRAFKNNWYVVMIYDNTLTTHGEAIKVMIQNHTDTVIKNHWSELQNIKNKIFGPEKWAIEYFPSKDELIDEHNIYWIWLFNTNILPIPL